MTNPRTTRLEVLARLLPTSVESNTKSTSLVAVFAMASLVRAFEQRLLKAFSEGKIAGTVHTALGQEVNDVRLMWSMNSEVDHVFGNHRNHGQLLAWGAAPDQIFAEIMGRQAGVGRGFGGSQHMAVPGFHTSGVQGGLAGIAVGTGLVSKKTGDGGISNLLLGDGTLGEGIVYEAMNLASAWGSPTLFTVVDNGIAQTTPREWTVTGDIAARGAAFDLPTFECSDSDYKNAAAVVQNAVETARTSQGPVLLVTQVDRHGPHSKGDDDRPNELLELFAERDPLKNLRSGIDGSAVEHIENSVSDFIEDAFKKADASAFSVPLNIQSERNGLLSAASTDEIKASGESRLLNSLGDALGTSLDSGAVLTGEDLLDPYGGAFKVSKGLSTTYPDQVLSSPISEAALVGAAIGFALCGKPAIAEIMFGDFITLAADQIINQASKIPSIYGEDQQLPITIRMPSGGYRGYGATHSQSLESMFLGVPNISVVAATHRLNSGELLRRAIQEWPYPTIFVENKLLYSEFQDTLDYQIVDAQEGSLESLFPTLISRDTPRESDVTLIGYGGMVSLMEQAATTLREEEITVSIIIPTLLSPLPIDSIGKVFGPTQITVVVEEGHVANGFGAELVASLLESAPQKIGKVRRVGASDSPIPAARAMEANVLPTSQKIVNAVLEIFESDTF
jgi:2-oxoisovalerate dehydrogenase E1 component